MVAPQPTAAEERSLEFIEGLRQRRYYDTAVDYIRELGQRSDVAPEIAVRLPYEEGITLAAGAAVLKNADKQKEQLDEAAARFEEFVKKAPKDHPLLGEANMQRARIAQQKARVEIWQASMPANEGNADAFRQRARGFIKTARETFQQAFDQYETQFKAFPTFIPEDEKQRRAERAQVESQYMQAQFDLARTIYDEAQTYPEGSEERKKRLNEAADAFEQMHQKYRSQVAGLFARLWQGKSFEEQDEIRKALGIYNEILDHPGNTASMERLQDTARRFRLICLNHPSRADHRLVVDEASAWRAGARNRAQTEVGLGITFELARAYEAIGDDRSTPPAEKNDALKNARSFASQVSLVPGELRGPAMSMVQRVTAKLGQEQGDPTSFDAAYGQANLLLEDYKKYQAEAEAARSKNDQKAAAAASEKATVAAQEMVRLYRLAITLARSSTDADQLAVAYFRLVYSHYVAGENLPAAVLGKYVAQRYRESNKQVAAEAAYIAIAAFTQEFNAGQAGNRDFELAQVVEVTEQIIEDFPESDRANDGKMTVAQLFDSDAQPERAAEWFDRVAETSQSFADSRLQGGLAFYNAFVVASNKPDGERPSQEQLNELRNKAEQRLQTGIDRSESKLASDSKTPDLLAICKLVLAGIRNADGVYKTQGEGGSRKTGSIALLTEGPHSVIKAVTVPEGAERPKSAAAMTSRSKASAAYQALLRAYIGVRDLDKARETREQLEAVVAADDAAELTRIYESFGRTLQEELKQLRQAGKTEEVSQTQSAFEEFLDQLASREDGQTYNSLYWIAETYNGLGEGAREAGSSEAKGFFDKSTSAYNRIIDTAGSDPSFLPDPAYLTGVQVRLANSQRSQGDYPAAEKTILGVLAEKPLAIDAQREAARLYEDWGESTGDASKYETALVGKRENKVWGWGQTAKRLQIATGQQPDNEDFRQQMFDAKYAVGETSLKLGKQRTDGEAAKQDWETGRRDLMRFAAVLGDFPAEEYRRFNELYKKLLTALGEPERDLELAETQLVSAEAPDDFDDADAAPAPAAAAEPASEAGGAEINIVPLAIVGLLALGGIGYFVMSGKSGKSGKSKPRRSRGGRPKAGRAKPGPDDAVAKTSKRSSRKTGKTAPAASDDAKPDEVAAKKADKAATKAEKPAKSERRSSRRSSSRSSRKSAKPDTASADAAKADAGDAGGASAPAEGASTRGRRSERDSRRRSSRRR